MTRSSIRDANSTVILLVVCAAQFMVVLDVSVVNVGLPSIRDALKLDESDLQWIVNAYALTFAGFLLLGGRLADLYGHRRTFLAGLLLFSGASLVGGLADSGHLLVGARALQGLGAAVLAPATLTILNTRFLDGPARTRALATWTAVGIAGGTAGNLAGGVLTEFLTWRSILLINVPIGVVGALMALRYVPPGKVRSMRPRLDVPGAILATGGLGALAFGVAQAARLGWGSPVTLGCMASGAVALAAFVVVETRTVNVPLIPMRLFRNRSVVIGNGVMLFAGACLNPMWFFLTLSMQNILHYSPLQTGLAFLPHTIVAIAVGMGATPWLMRRIDGRVLISAGSLIAALGFWWQAHLETGSGYLLGILLPAVVFSIGSGLLNTPITAAVLSGVDDDDAGAASGLMNTTKQVGGALGLAVLVTLSSTSPTVLDGYNRAFILIAVVMGIVAFMALALPSHRDRA
ncbi:MFS transporter [Rhodococcus sp. BGS-1C]|uniref:MFS transporter n=1 Tax=unclassified Rhodococcus (in: high G+C Gram-positive bacteria) TaxID=192944 RepID=UPI0019D0814F|nr:MFS transporter [Rhodococcus sp. KRD197]